MQITQIQSFNPQETICSKVNVRPAAKATDIDELANDIEHHGQLQPVIIRFEDGKPAVIAGQRRRKALRKLCRKDPSVTLEGLVVDVDDMEATAISLSENKNQLPMSALDSYKAFSKLAKLGWDAQSISQIYSLTLKEVRQTLALGDLPVSIIKAHEADDIDDDCLKLLAIAPKGRLNQWVKLYRDGNAPTWGRDVRSFLANDQEVIKTEVALFDLAEAEAEVALIDDFFENETFFADPEQFWVLQRAEVEAIKSEYEAKRWTVDVIESDYSSWQYRETSKKAGGKVLIFVSSTGKVEVKRGLLSNAEVRALERQRAGDLETEGDLPKEKPEVTKKMNEYLLGYFTQAAQSSVIADYDLTQRVLLVMLLTGDGKFLINHCDQLSRINAEVTNGELFATPKHIESKEFAKTAFKAIKSKPDTHYYQSGVVTLLKKVMKLKIDAVQALLQAVLASAITPSSETTLAINEEVKPDMTEFWNAETSRAFVQVAQGKPLLFSILRTLSNKETAALYEKSKVVDIKTVIQEKANEKENWLPAYFIGGHYGNGLGVPKL